MAKTYQTFEAFWPYYLSEHGDPTNRRLHYVGSTLALLNLFAAIALLNPWFILGALVSGYFFAWIGHFIIEKNRPATFTYPVWSLIADFRMYFLALAGRLRPHLERAGIAA